MNKTAPGLALLLLVFATSSCGIFQRTAAGSGELPERSAKFLMKKMAQQQVSTAWFSARARVDYEGENFSVSATANLRMTRDSAIWANVKKLNLEVGRALIRPDSFFVIDRINRQFSRHAVSEIAELFKLPANYQILQSVLLGNPFFLNAEHQAGIEEGFYTLTGEDDRFAATYYLDGKNYSLQKIVFTEKQQKREVSMELKDYKALGKKQNFSYFRTIRADSPETGPLFIDIEFSKVEINTPKSIEFDIPNRYNEINRP